MCDLITKAMSTVRDYWLCVPVDREQYVEACEVIAREFVQRVIIGELESARQKLRRCVIELAALIPDSANPDENAWPCQNPADRSCLQSAFLQLVELRKYVESLPINVDGDKP